jgi:hypothetical protein
MTYLEYKINQKADRLDIHKIRPRGFNSRHGLYIRAISGSNIF